MDPAGIGAERVRVEEAQELWAARISDVVQLKAALADARSRVVATVLQADGKDVPSADLHRSHVLHGGVRVMICVGELLGGGWLGDVDDVDTRARAVSTPLADECEVLVACHVCEGLFVDLAGVSFERPN